MSRPLAYITADFDYWEDNRFNKAREFCRDVYNAGYSPICPFLFHRGLIDLEDSEEYEEGRKMANELLRRGRILVVCGVGKPAEVREDIALAKRLQIPVTTFSGILEFDECEDD